MHRHCERSEAIQTAGLLDCFVGTALPGRVIARRAAPWRSRYRCARNDGEANPMKRPAIYIMANKRNGTVYTGVTSNLVQRVSQHKQGMTKGFTLKYG
jgi:hypothetical protein